MEICVKELPFALKNCDGKIPEKIKFNNDDLVILDKFKNNLDIIRDKIDNLDLNFYINSFVSLYLTNKYFNEKEP